MPPTRGLLALPQAPRCHSGFSTASRNHSARQPASRQVKGPQPLRSSGAPVEGRLSSGWGVGRTLQAQPWWGACLLSPCPLTLTPLPWSLRPRLHPRGWPSPSPASSQRVTRPSLWKGRVLSWTPGGSALSLCWAALSSKPVLNCLPVPGRERPRPGLWRGRAPDTGQRRPQR